MKHLIKQSKKTKIKIKKKRNNIQKDENRKKSPLNQRRAWTEVSEGKKKMAHTLQSVCLTFVQEIGKKCAKIELPWRWFDRYTVKEKKRRKDNFGHLCRLPTNGFRFSKSRTIHWLKKSLPPQKNQSAREIQNWPTD